MEVNVVALDVFSCELKLVTETSLIFYPRFDNKTCFRLLCTLNII